MAILKVSTARNRMIFMVDSTDHVSGKASLSLTITASKDGGAFNTITPTVTDRSNGWYELALDTTMTNTQGDLALHITATGADPTDLVDQVCPDLPGNATVTGGVNVTQIDGQATNGNNATLNLKQLNIVNNAGDAIVASSTGSNGNGLNASGNGTGAGVKATGGATGPGQNWIGGATSGNGLTVTTTSGDGFNITASGTAKNGINVTGAAASGVNAGGHGFLVTGGASTTSAGGTAGRGAYFLGGAGAASTNGPGQGFRIEGGGTTTVAGADGLRILGTGNTSGGSGMNITASGGGGHGIVTTASSGPGHGFFALGGGGNGNGIEGLGGGTGAGFLAQGGGTGPGISAVGGNASGATAAGSGATFTGGTASSSGGGTAGVGMVVTGGAGAASTNGAAVGATVSGGGINTVSSAADGLKLTGTSTGVSLNGPQGISAAITGNITGNLSGSVGSVTSGVTVTTNNDKTGYALSSAGVQAIWDALTSALTTVGSVGKRIADFLTGDAFVRLGAPAGASVSADIAGMPAAVLNKDISTIESSSPADSLATAVMAATHLTQRNAITGNLEILRSDNVTVQATRVLTTDATAAPIVSAGKAS